MRTVQQREIQLKKAVALQTAFAPKVRERMMPALSALGLDYFWFVRLLEGEHHISVGIQAPQVELYRERKTEDLYFKNSNILTQKQTTVLWDLHEPTPLTGDMTTRIGLGHGMCVFRRKPNYVDVFYVASTQKTSNLYQLYIDQTEAIYRLIGFFEQAVLPLLPMKNKDFLLPYMDGALLHLPKMTAKDEKSTLTDFYDATRLKKFTLHSDKGDFSLSLRELQCVYHLATGKTSKEIAQALALSHRTVEHYIEDIRHKTACIDKGQLVELYRKNDVALWFDAFATHRSL